MCMRLHLYNTIANRVQYRGRRVKLKTEPWDQGKGAMKHRSTQLGVCKNPDSPRVHGLRLSVNSSSLESVRGFQNPHDQTEAFSSPLSKTETFELPLIDVLNEAAVGRERTPDQLLTVTEVAALLHLPVSWVYGRMRKRASDRLPGYRLGKYWRFREQEILEWVKRHRGGGHHAA